MKRKLEKTAAFTSMRQDLNLPKVPAVCIVRSPDGFPPGINVAGLTKFFHKALKPFEDSPEDIERGIRDCLAARGRTRGFLLMATLRRKPVGALVMQRTGMKGYVPENLLLFVAVSPALRNRGIGRLLVERAIQEARGSIKLHVEYDNPARHLYERLGFTNKYAEMRYLK